VQHAEKRGATVIEAYPVDPSSPSYRFMGYVRTFVSAGFYEVGRAGTRRHVLRANCASSLVRLCPSRVRGNAALLLAFEARRTLTRVTHRTGFMSTRPNQCGDAVGRASAGMGGGSAGGPPRLSLLRTSRISLTCAPVRRAIRATTSSCRSSSRPVDKSLVLPDTQALFQFAGRAWIADRPVAQQAQARWPAGRPPPIPADARPTASPHWLGRVLINPVL